MKKNKSKKLIVPSIIFIIGTIITLISFFASSGLVQGTALSDDYSVTRITFPNIETIATSQSGIAEIPSTVNSDNIYQIDFIVKGCSGLVSVSFDGVDYGTIGFPECEQLYSADNEGEEGYVHYVESKKIVKVNGLSKDKISYSFIPKINDDKLSFDYLGEEVSVLSPISEYKINIYEEVVCTRSSHCTEGDIYDKNGNLISSGQGICKPNHRCSYILGDVSVEDINDIPSEEEEKPISKYNWWILIIGLVIAILLAYGYYWFFERRKK